MKITSFNPLIATKDAEPIISLFEALGFEKRHAPSNTAASGNDFTDKILTCTVLLIRSIIRHHNRPTGVLLDAAIQQS